MNETSHKTTKRNIDRDWWIVLSIMLVILYLLCGYILGVFSPFNLEKTLPPVINLAQPEPGQVISENSDGHFPTVVSVHETKPDTLVFIITNFWGKVNTKEIQIKEAPEGYTIAMFDGFIISIAYYNGGYDENGNIVLALKPKG